MEEKVFYENGSVKITDKRFIIGGITYVLSNITSIKKVNGLSLKPIGVILIVIGVLILLSGNFLASLFFIISGWLIFRYIKRNYIVNLATSSGAVMAYGSKDEAEIDTIIKELNNAFISKTT